MMHRPDPEVERLAALIKANVDALVEAKTAAQVETILHEQLGDASPIQTMLLGIAARLGSLLSITLSRAAGEHDGKFAAVAQHLDDALVALTKAGSTLNR